MAAKYTPITIEEMRDTLRADRGWVESTTRQDGGGEYVYTRSLASVSGVQIKVFSSISAHADASRGCGQDAIRVCAILAFPDGTTRGLVKSISVHRTQNWRTTLMTRVQEVFEVAKERAKW